jgi:hypothetical protein
MVFNDEHLLVIVLGVGMLILGGLVVFLLVNKKKSSCNKCPPGGLKKWIDFSKNAKKYTSDDDSKKKYNSFCKNPTNDNWIKAFDVQGDPHTNGFYDFSRNRPTCPKTNCPTCPICDSPNKFINSGENINDFNNICCDNSTKSLRSDSKNPNGYNDYCVKNTNTSLCPTCGYSNAEWMNINGLNDPDPSTNGYNDFCVNSSGSSRDWFDKVVPILPPLPKGTNGNDPKINGYNKFCGK